MSNSVKALVDTGPLTHLAQTGHLSVLEMLTRLDIEPVMPPQVRDELAEKPSLNKPALSSQVIAVSALIVEADELADFIRDRELPKKGNPFGPIDPYENAGEAACIGYALHHSEETQPFVFIDDKNGRDLARSKGLVCLTTLDTLACLVRLGQLTTAEAEKVVADLLRPSTGKTRGYILPVKTSLEFIQMYQLNDRLPAPSVSELCLSCLDANKISEGSAEHLVHSLCHIGQGWRPEPINPLPPA